MSTTVFTLFSSARTMFNFGQALYLRPSDMMSQIYTIASFELQTVFRRKRTLIAFVLYIFCAASLVFGIGYLQSELDNAMKQVGIPESELYQLFYRLLEQFHELPRAEVEAILNMLKGWPVSVWLFQICSILLLPTVIALVASDVIAIDVYRRTLRFILLKTSRTSYYLGKVIAHFVLFGFVHLLSVLGLLLVSFYFGSVESMLDLTKAATLSFLIFLPFLLLAVALTAWVSSWCSKPQTALILVHAVWFLSLFLVPYLPMLSPFGPDLLMGIIFPKGGQLVWSLVGIGIWCLALLLLGSLGFNRREV